MEILTDKDNFLLKRREVKFVIEADKNPSFEEAGFLIAKDFNAHADHIAVKEVNGKFGRNTFLIKAFIYANKDDKAKFEKKKEKKAAPGK